MGPAAGGEGGAFFFLSVAGFGFGFFWFCFLVFWRVDGGGTRSGRLLVGREGGKAGFCYRGRIITIGVLGSDSDWKEVNGKILRMSCCCY